MSTHMILTEKELTVEFHLWYNMKSHHHQRIRTHVPILCPLLGKRPVVTHKILPLSVIKVRTLKNHLKIKDQHMCATKINVYILADAQIEGIYMMPFNYASGNNNATYALGIKNTAGHTAKNMYNVSLKNRLGNPVDITDISVRFCST